MELGAPLRGCVCVRARTRVCVRVHGCARAHVLVRAHPLELGPGESRLLA